jgi:hypothetical protein
VGLQAALAEPVVRREETEEERGRREAARRGQARDFPALSPDVAASWGMPPTQGGAPAPGPTASADSRAHTSPPPARKPTPGSDQLPRLVPTVAVIHFGTFGQHYVTAKYLDPSMWTLQTAPDPVAGVNFDTYIRSETRMIPATALGGDRYRVFTGSPECPGCHFGRGLEVDLGGENPITATLPSVLATVTPHPGGGPPPKRGIEVRVVRTGPSRPYDPNPVGPSRQLPPATPSPGTPAPAPAFKELAPPAAPPSGPLANAPVFKELAPPAAQSPAGTAAASPRASLPSGVTPPARQLGPGPGPSVVTFEPEVIDGLIQMWRDEIVRQPNRAADFQRYITNLQERRNLLASNRPGGVARSGEQSEREIQFVLQSRQKRIQTSAGRTTPDATVGTTWAAEIKHWNILYPTEAEMAAAAQGRLPNKLQALVDQVARRREQFGNRQTVIIDLRGQLTVTGVDAAQAARNRTLIDSFGRIVANATGLPVEQIQVVVW